MSPTLLCFLLAAGPADPPPPPAAKPPPIEAAGWRTHPAVVAIRERVTAIDAKAVAEGPPATTCATWRPHADPKGSSADDDAGFGALSVRTTRAKVPGTALARTVTEVRRTDHTGADTPWNIDATFTAYHDGGRPLFVFVRATEVGQAYLERELRVYFDDRGQPVWSVGDNRTHGGYHEQVTRQGLIAPSDWQQVPPAFDLLPPSTPAGDRAAIGRRWLAEGASCSAEEAPRLHRLAAEGVATGDDRALVRRYLRLARPDEE